jgi:hypothetical protein
VTTPVNADDSGSHRWYTHPVTGERFLSATAALSYIAKHELPAWAAKLSATAAIDAWSRVREAAEIDPCERKGNEACGQCRTCVAGWLANRHNVVRDTASDLGSRFHQAVDNQVKLGPGCYVDADVQPFLDAYNEWAELAQPVFRGAEMTVINRRLGYAGTLDAINFFSVKSELPKKMQHLKRRTVLVDYKTGKSVGAPHAWQLNAYRFAEKILLPDGTELPMPRIGTGLILHIRPKSEGGVKMREAFLTSQNFKRFVHALRIAEAMMSPLGESLSRPAYFPTPKEA